MDLLKSVLLVAIFATGMTTVYFKVKCFRFLKDNQYKTVESVQKELLTIANKYTVCGIIFAVLCLILIFLNTLF